MTTASFALRHPAEILAILDRLKTGRVPTTVAFGHDEAIVSSVLQIDRYDHTMTFDVASDADVNRRLFAASRLHFESQLDQIRITFSTDRPSPFAASDGLAASVAIPEAVTRLQRREWFRALLPVEPPVRCTVLDANGRASPARAVDLSCGGAALVVDDPALHDAAPGTEHELILSLPDIGRFDIEATLQNVLPTRTPGATGRVRLGFRFQDLSPKAEAQIQRFVQQLEVNQLRMLRRRA